MFRGGRFFPDTVYIYIGKKVNYFPMLMDPYGVADLCLITSRSHKTTDTGLVHRVVCPFTPQLSIVLNNQPRRDGMLSWRWYTAAAMGFLIASPVLYVTATRAYIEVSMQSRVCLRHLYKMSERGNVLNCKHQKQEV